MATGVKKVIIEARVYPINLLLVQVLSRMTSVSWSS